jgi:hypothetical protein
VAFLNACHPGSPNFRAAVWFRVRPSINHDDPSMNTDFHPFRRRPLVWIGIAAIVCFVAFTFWQRIDPPPGQSHPSTPVSIVAERPSGSETGSALLRGSPAGELTPEQQRIVVETDAQLLEMDACWTEWIQECNRNKVHEPALTAAWKHQKALLFELIGPPGWSEYVNTHQGDWSQALVTRADAWRPLILIELLRDPDASGSLREIANALANNPDYRKTLAGQLQATLGQDVNLDGEGVEGLLNALRPLEPALRDHLKSPLTVPPAFQDHLQQLSKVLTLGQLLAAYGQPLSAKQEALGSKVAELGDDIRVKLDRLPVASDPRSRLATRLQQFLYPAPK